MNKIWLLYVFIFLLSCDKNEDKNKFSKLAGHAFGTTFHITHESKNDYQYERQIDSLIHLINKSLSTYMQNSDISKINKGDTSIVVDEFFLEVFSKSKTVYNETDGWYDPTIGILVNAWGFGPEEKMKDLDSVKINQMLNKVGFDKVELSDDRTINNQNQVYFDFNALAKGYAVDVIGRFLEENDIENYMVEIGGEIRVRGFNNKGKHWLIAIESPNFDGSRTFQTKIALKDESVATSGNYRKFKTDLNTGEKYAHIINPKTGFPVKSKLLSVSIISNKDCGDVDGYATALMAMGLERTQEFLAIHSDLKAFLIYIDTEGNLNTLTYNNLKEIH